MLRAENRPREILKTFVGGLPFHCNEQELGQFMSQFGIVHEVYISKDPTGFHKGFAFVNFSAVEQTERLFGEHYFKSKLIEVKQNLHNQLILPSLPENTDENTIRKAIEDLGFLVAVVTLGTEFNGVPPGSASVRLAREDQVGLALGKGKVLIKDIEVEINTRVTKKVASSATLQSKDFSGKKKFSRQNIERCFNNGREEDRRLGSLQGLSKSSLGGENLEQAENIVGLFHSFTKLSFNEDLGLSAFEFGGANETDSVLFGKPTRKLSSSLKTNSKEYFLSPSKLDSLVLGRESSGVLSLDNDNSSKVISTTRHNSECGIPTEIDTPTSKRLNGCSTSFFSGNSSGMRLFSPPLSRPSEVRIRFFTFPDRD